MSTVFDETKHPRSTGGQFAEKHGDAPLAPLPGPIPKSVWLRTSAGIRQFMATSEQNAREQLATLHPDEVYQNVVDPDVEVCATAGPIRVTYHWDGEGYDGEWDPIDPMDTPLLRVTVEVQEEDGDYADAGSWCTANTTLIDPDILSSRASSVASILAEQASAGEDPYAVVGRFLARNRDVVDPVLTRPTTPRMIAEAYPDRTESGVVLGYYVTKRATGEHRGQPLAHMDEAEATAKLLNGSMFRDYDVHAGPVFTPDGNVVIA